MCKEMKEKEVKNMRGHKYKVNNIRQQMKGGMFESRGSSSLPSAKSLMPRSRRQATTKSMNLLSARARMRSRTNGAIHLWTWTTVPTFSMCYDPSVKPVPSFNL